MGLEGKTAVVTGGSRGIGRAICLELARQGAKVVFSYVLNEDAARETEALCADLPGSAVGHRADAANAADVKALIEGTAEALGRLDILVNNAGVTRDALAIRMSEEDFDRVIATNLRGVFLCCKTAGRVMLKQRYGRIVNISSVTALRGNPGQINYTASKAGVIGLTKTLAKELAARGVTVNAVAPGFITTDMTDAIPENVRHALRASIPVGRPGTGADVAAAVAFLASDAAGYITGQVLCVDGGMAV